MTQSFKDVKNLIKSKKARDEQGLFVTEGIKIFSETPMDRVEAVFATAEFAGEHPEMISRIPAGTECVLDVRADRFAGLSDTKSPQGIIAVVRKKKYTLSDILGLPGQQSEVPGGSNREECEIGRVAVEKFAASEPGYYDAILMDMRMPEMDGLEATNAIRAMKRQDAKTIPIIALTANAFDEDVQRSMQAGLNAHLSKPVEPEALFETLENLIKA